MSSALLLLLVWVASGVSGSCSIAANSLSLRCSGDISNMLALDRELLVRVTDLRVEDCASVTLNSAFFRFFKSLSSVHIRCATTDIESGTFASLVSSVSYLSVGNAISCFSAKTFCPLDLRGVVDLRDNLLNSDDDFGLLTNCSSYRWAGHCGKNIKQLMASGNNLTSLNKEGFLCALQGLEALDVSGNAISRVESGTFDAANKLRNLNLARNSLTELPVDLFDQLTVLQNLRLNDNFLTALPAGIFKNSELLALDISGNRIQTLDGRFRNLNALRELNLSRNQLQHVNSSLLVGLTNLETLSLSGNDVITLTKNAFAGSFRLLNLDLSQNNLTNGSFPHFVGLENLELFNLSRNHLSHFRFSWFPHSLDSLDLSHNRIVHLPAFTSGGLPRLRSLDLSGNLLQRVSRGHLPPTLRRLFLSSNRIARIDPGAFERLPELSLLSLRHNGLTALPDSVLPASLASVDLAGNPWRCQWTSDTDFWSFVHTYQHKITDFRNIYCIPDALAERTSGGSINASLSTLSFLLIHYLMLA